MSVNSVKKKKKKPFVFWNQNKADEEIVRKSRRRKKWFLKCRKLRFQDCDPQSDHAHRRVGRRSLSSCFLNFLWLSHLRKFQQRRQFWKAVSGRSVAGVFLTAAWCSSQETARCSPAASPSTTMRRSSPTRRWRPPRRNSARRLLRQWSRRAPSPSSPSAGQQRNRSQSLKGAIKAAKTRTHRCCRWETRSAWCTC